MKKFGKRFGTHNKDVKPKIFGEQLDHIIEPLPTVIRSVVEFFDVHGVEVEGLFRISAGAGDLKKWIDLFENGATEITPDVDAHVAANVLKQYLRSMPEPLLSFEKYSDFMDATALPEEQMISEVKKILATLPIVRRVTLKFLMEFLCEVSQKSEINKMTPANIAIVFAPNILKPPGDDIHLQLTDSGNANRLIQLFVREYEKVFADEPDPPDEGEMLEYGYKGVELMNSANNQLKPPLPPKPNGLFQSSFPPKSLPVPGNQSSGIKENSAPPTPPSRVPSVRLSQKISLSSGDSRRQIIHQSSEPTIQRRNITSSRGAPFPGTSAPSVNLAPSHNSRGAPPGTLPGIPSSTSSRGAPPVNPRPGLIPPPTRARPTSIRPAPHPPPTQSPRGAPNNLPPVPQRKASFPPPPPPRE